jgi:hypothetical protein
VGYFTSGCVFTSEPRFADIAAAFPRLVVRGYRHAAEPIWLLDLYKKPTRGQQSPFTARANQMEVALGSPAAEATALLGGLESLLGALPKGAGHGARELRLALAVAEPANASTFYFAGDDDLVDFACVVDRGSVHRLRCRMQDLTVAHERGRTEILPHVLVLHDDETPSPELLRLVRNAVDWAVGVPRELAGDHPLHESAVALWPTEAGDPAALLGVGTWDPLENLARDFRVVFET